MKKVQGIYRAPRQHWVGDGFPVRSLFSYQSHGKQLSPFLLLDYAGPMDFTPTQHRRGVGQHPHRGFETVTIVYDGEVEHRDSTGKGGIIGPGDVQWMTAGGGILHEEFHSDAFAKRGGAFEMVQLWVNLPAKDKMTAPGYQAIRNETIPQVALAEGAGSLRVIAGDYAGKNGPANTFSPLNVWDIRLNQGKSAEFSLPDGWNTALIVLRGTVQVNGDAIARDAEMVLLDSAGSNVTIEANNDAVLLLLSGEPIDEPIIGYGPFVMNTQEQIAEAIADFNSGRFGSMDSHA
ncbi:TPA: pirin family protein [Yersinia enterocolitica]|uniref:pirin family protein n=1 Tax=Yersinia enterocolitica TaxID=630 RepID=UPI0005FD0C27|nr:pirin family protein [Yersinia enterocolitica]EKN5932380.1 pirin family protein [Yersinia enterocolitica]ELX2275153.1 pirin family protein [Yersinia enterocolitica]ELY5259696.1 pirin family protein [Yersinia enterocolitica]CRF10035.1 pirin family protein [Yersinia enterocolitica]HDL6627528.1 pirin family protein [Yersinia enterocolitica]